MHYFMYTNLMQTFRIKISQNSNSEVHPLLPPAISMINKYIIVNPFPVLGRIFLIFSFHASDTSPYNMATILCPDCF